MRILFLLLILFFTENVVAQSSVSLTRGPYLQMGNKTGITIRWRTDIAAASKIELGTVLGLYTKVKLDPSPVTEHIIRIDTLSPNTKYFYRVGTDTSILEGDSANFFTTAPLDTTTRKISIAVFGDCGRDENSFQTKTLSAYRKYLTKRGLAASELLLLLGDNAYNNGTDLEYTTNFFSPYSSTILKNHVLFPAPGNHDYANDLTAQKLHNVPYYSIFSMPTAGECGGIASGNQAYYSFDRGGIHFLSLDSYGLEDTGTTRLYDTLGEQVKWIKKDLAATDKKWIIAYWHHPPYTKGSHNSDTEDELIRIRERFIGILERYGVDLILTGHSHNYERSYLLKQYTGDEASFNKLIHTADSSSAQYNGSLGSCPYTYKSGKYNHGIVYVVAGSSGADGVVQAGYPHDALPYSIHDGGMLFLEIQDNRLDAKFIRKDDSIADQFTIIKDAQRKDTISIYKGNSTLLKASWLGAYSWSSLDTTRSILVSPTLTTTYSVQDSASNPCLADWFTVKVIDTTTQITALTKGLNESIVYPIPTQELLNLEIENNISASYTISIYDSKGMMLTTFVRKIDAGKQIVPIDVRSFPIAQLLLIKIQHLQSSKTLRFIRKE